MKKNKYPNSLNSKRLVLRAVDLKDLQIMNKTVNKNYDRLHKVMCWCGKPATTEDTESFIKSAIVASKEGREIHYSIFRKEDNKFMGVIGACVRTYPGFFEIGYWIDEECEGFGYTSEATALLVDILKVFTHARRIQIRCNVNNIKSANIPRKLGFQEECVLKNYDMGGDGMLHDSIIFSLT